MSDIIFESIPLFMIGLIIGSFINVLIYRAPLEESVISPSRSHCPDCGSQIKWYENIPVLSYMYLKGRCSNCNARISPIYPAVELIVAFGAVYLFGQFGLSVVFVLHWLLFLTLVCLSFIDLKTKAVPDYLLIIAIAIALLVGDWIVGLLFIGGAFILQLILDFYIQTIKSRITKNDSLKEQQAMGDGDIPIFGAIGSVLGVQLGISAIFFAAIFALVPAVYNMLKNKDIETPFIPFLVIGLYFAMLTKINLFNLFV